MRRSAVLLPVLLALLVGAEPALAWTWPVDGPVLQHFTLGNDEYAAGQHRGVDIGGVADAPVVAPAGGIVTYAGTIPGSGLTVSLRTADGYSVTLLHLGTVDVPRGSTVAEGDVVGTLGPSGEAEHSEPYVHLGIRVAAEPNGYVDPLGLLPAPGESAVATEPVAADPVAAQAGAAAEGAAGPPSELPVLPSGQGDAASAPAPAPDQQPGTDLPTVSAPPPPASADGDAGADVEAGAALPEPAVVASVASIPVGTASPISPREHSAKTAGEHAGRLRSAAPPADREAPDRPRGERRPGPGQRAAHGLRGASNRSRDVRMLPHVAPPATGATAASGIGRPGRALLRVALLTVLAALLLCVLLRRLPVPSRRSSRTAGGSQAALQELGGHAPVATGESQAMPWTRVRDERVRPRRLLSRESPPSRGGPGRVHERRFSRRSPAGRAV